jgi:hypothetical protein
MDPVRTDEEVTRPTGPVGECGGHPIDLLAKGGHGAAEALPHSLAEVFIECAGQVAAQQAEQAAVE